MLKEIAGEGNFFVEIFPHKMTHHWQPPKIKNKKILEKSKLLKNESSELAPDGDLQKAVNKYMISLAKKYNDPILISVDSHFADPKDKLIQDAKLGNGLDTWKYYNSYHLMSSSEAANILMETLDVSVDEIEEWIDNSYKWASLFDQFCIKTCEDRWILPELSPEWKIQLKNSIDKYGRMDWSNKEMVNRLKYELDIITNNGKINLMGYFFNIEKVSNYCKENGILMNVRGSAGGSLLLYLLGINATNPILYDLSFERFLTVGRIRANTLPDVDVDISDKDFIMKFLQECFGDGFCQISTNIMLKLKSSIKDAERALRGCVSAETEKMCKKLPNSPQGVNERDWALGYENDDGEYIPGLWDTNEGLKSWADTHIDVWGSAKLMLDIQRQKSVHACGAVIADRPIQEYCPVVTVVSNKKKTKVTGYCPKSVELAGLVKYDFLGVNTLKDIEIALRSIKDRHGLDIDPWHLPNDDDVFDDFCAGHTESVFQFNTSTVIPYLKKTRPRSISELAAITALCRPGTLDAPSGDGRTLAELFVARCNGEEIKYIHQDLEPILKETMGIQLYQEQTLKIFMELAGYSYEQAETVRRGIGKKKEAVLKECMGDLRNSCLVRGWEDHQINLLIDQIMASSNYSFNKSHAVSYAIVAYACAYLKRHYNLEWWKGCLSNAKKDELSNVFWKYVKDFTLLPDINYPYEEYVIDGDRLRSPISTLKGIGSKTYQQLIDRAPYKDMASFVEAHFNKGSKTRSSVHTGIAHKLIAAGVLDSLFTDKNIKVEEKLTLFEQEKSKIRKEKLSPVPEQYINTTPLGDYLMKKVLIPIYSEDLRPIMLPPRDGTLLSNGAWKVNDYVVVNGKQIQNVRAKTIHSAASYGEITCIAYVIDEKIINYKNKTKQATKIFVDSGGEFFEDVLWPSWGENVSASGFKNVPVLLVYKMTPDRLQLTNIVPLLQKEEFGKYNTL